MIISFKKNKTNKLFLYRVITPKNTARQLLNLYLRGKNINQIKFVAAFLRSKGSLSKKLVL